MLGEIGAVPQNSDIHFETMAPFSTRVLRRSPRGRKRDEQQQQENDVKIANDAPLQPDTQGDSDLVAVSKGISNGEIRERRGLNKRSSSSLLHNLRSRLTGKLQSSAPQRGSTSQHEVRATFLILALALTPK